MLRPKLFVDLENLYDNCYDRIKNFPKLDKYLLGKEILYLINETHKFALISMNDKFYLSFASANFDLFKKSMRIAVKKELISQNWYAEQLELIVSIGREIGGWMRKAKTPQS